MSYQTQIAAIKKMYAIREGMTELEYEQKLMWDELKKDHTPNYCTILEQIRTAQGERS